MYLALDLGTFLHIPFIMCKYHVINWNLFCRDMKVLIKPVNKHKLKVGYSVHFTDPYSLLLRGADVKFYTISAKFSHGKGSAIFSSFLSHL